MALFNNFPYSKTEEINLDYTLNKLNELYSRGENLYAELQTWKTETDEANEAWKSDLLSDINEWQNSVTHSLEEWKTSVDSEVSNALTTLSNQITAELAQAKTDLRDEVADLASAAEASAADAAKAASDAVASQSAAAQSAETAINSAAAAARSEQNISASAEQINTNKDDIADLKSAFTSYAVDGEYLPIPKSAFAQGTVLNGVYNPSVKYRVSTPELVDIIDKTTIYVKSGFKLYLYFYDDGAYTGITITTNYEIPANSKLKIVILRVTEDTTEIANVDYFVSQINTSNKLVDVDQIKNDVYTLKGDISVKSGTNDITACTSQISRDRLIRFASNPTLKGGSKVDSIIYKSNYAKNVDFYIGEITSENNIQIKEVINCPVVVGTNTLINGVDFVSNTVVKNNCVIGYRCEPIAGLSTNGYFGGSEGSFVADSFYITPPIAGDVISTEKVTYGIGLSMTLKTFSVPELTIEIGNLTDQSNQINVPWEYAIDNVICIGDSLTSGSPADSSTMPYPLKQNYPWYLSRMLGAECTNTGVPGIATKGWYTNEYSKYTMSDYNTFIIFLGTNGGLTNTLATDVDPYDDYHNFADTQTGYYCRIIANILADRPDAFIILVNTWYNGSNQTETRTTIDAIGTKYSLPVVETVGVMPYSVNPIYHGNVDNVHCSKAGYLALADLIRSTIRDYIKAHPAVANKAMSQGV